jgi:hypothetical protein
VQLLHTLLPESGVNLPAGQSSHECWWEREVNNPGRHAVGSVEHVEHEEPAGHDVHALAACRPGVFEYEPAWHGISTVAPGPQ